MVLASVMNVVLRCAKNNCRFPSASLRAGSPLPPVGRNDRMGLAGQNDNFEWLFAGGHQFSDWFVVGVDAPFADQAIVNRSADRDGCLPAVFRMSLPSRVKVPEATPIMTTTGSPG